MDVPIGALGGDVVVRTGDRLILYGRIPRITELDHRRAGGEGDVHHQQAVAEQERIAQQERANARR